MRRGWAVVGAVVLALIVAQGIVTTYYCGVHWQASGMPGTGDRAAKLLVELGPQDQPYVDSFPLLDRSVESAIAFAGDVFLGDGAAPTLRRRGPRHTLHNVASLLHSADADAVVGVQEGPLTLSTEHGLPQKKWSYGGRPEYASALRYAGFTHMALANNHILDRTDVGLADTLRHLDALGIGRFGAGRNIDEARRPVVVKLGNNITVAIVTGMQPFHKYLTWEAGKTRPGVALLRRETLKAQFDLAKAAQPDVIVAFPHWGSNYKPVTPDERALAGFLVEEGADVIIGHHPHIWQPAGYLGPKNVPVLWSLGNAVFGSPGRFMPEDSEAYGLIARLVVARDPASHMIKLRVEAIPFRDNNKVVAYQPKLCTVRDATRVLGELMEQAGGEGTRGPGHEIANGVLTLVRDL